MVTVTFVIAGDGAPTKAPIALEKGSILSVAQAAAPEYAGHDFLGWHEAPDLSAETRVEPGSYVVDEDVTLYANYWPTPPGLVRWDAQPVGSFPTASITLTFQGDVAPLTIANVSIAEGTGAATAGTLEEIAEGAYRLTISVQRAGAARVVITGVDNLAPPIGEPQAEANSRTVNITAAAQMPRYTVTFNGNGGLIDGQPTDAREVEGGQPIGPLPAVTRDGYDLVGWYNAADGGSQYTASSIVNGSLELWARWNQVFYTLTFNLNDGEGNFPPQQRTYGQTPEPPSLEPTRANHKFRGWFEAINGDTPFDFEAGMTDNATAHAQWIPMHTVTFHLNYAAPNPTHSAQTVEHGERPTHPGNPTRSGYTFAGWHTAQEQTGGVNYFEGGSPITGSITIWARWTEVPGGNFAGPDAPLIPPNWNSTSQSRAVAHGNGVFVVMGNQSRMAYSTNGGATWTNHGIPLAAAPTSHPINFNAVTHTNDGWFVALGHNGRGVRFQVGTGYLPRSFTAIDLSGSDLANGGSINGIAHSGGSNGNLVAVADNGIILRSTGTGGGTWSKVGDSKFGASRINGVAFGNNNFVAVGDNGQIARSSTGETWTATTVGIGGSDMHYNRTTFATTERIMGVAFGNNIFIVVGQNGRMARSNASFHWQTINAGNGSVVGNSTGGSRFPGNRIINAIAFSNGQWIAGGQAGVMSRSEDNGRTWTLIDGKAEVIVGSNISSLAGGGGRFVAVSDAGGGLRAAAANGQ